ncbi:MAG: hypothetical protein DI603_13870 [Roseateles depolymerans]|uniref:Ice-binding protein C-terminal domain-containing protein n=1 Tax=Roseateles depolymerans TaxID=76731 RepID=A0A2W5FJ89_9BURK|nr:MAG: hypothetical protein DI603_13870 [Roseateles depolymerans]
MKHLLAAPALFSLLALASASALAADLGSTGYQQDFDAMGTSGSAPPTGWTVLTGNSGTSNSSWTTSIPAMGANSVATLVATSGTLSAVTLPSGTNNNGFNAALSADATGDRVLATSPTTVSGAALQLALTNTTGQSIDQLLIGYDTVRYTSTATANELPGYWLFYSLDGASWSNVEALNPTADNLPNTVGVSSFAPTLVSLSAPLAAGQTFWLRWVDDNARQTSPDQIIGLNNLSISAVPEPGSALLLGAGLVLGALRRRRG